MIRIIGGTLRGRKLEVPSGLKVRPSADRVREALFNMLDHRLHWQDFNVLDLYAGSGALGIEALSRGARFLVTLLLSFSTLLIRKTIILRF